MATSNNIAWRKSSRCGNNACVEVAFVNGEYLLRDSKNPHIAPFTFTVEEWTAFEAGMSAGEFRLAEGS